MRHHRYGHNEIHVQLQNVPVAGSIINFIELAPELLSVFAEVVPKIVFFTLLVRPDSYLKWLCLSPDPILTMTSKMMNWLVEREKKLKKVNPEKLMINDETGT